MAWREYPYVGREVQEMFQRAVQFEEALVEASVATEEGREIVMQGQGLEIAVFTLGALGGHRGARYVQDMVISAGLDAQRAGPVILELLRIRALDRMPTQRWSPTHAGRDQLRREVTRIASEEWRYLVEMRRQALEEEEERTSASARATETTTGNPAGAAGEAAVNPTSEAGGVRESGLKIRDGQMEVSRKWSG